MNEAILQVIGNEMTKIEKDTGHGTIVIKITEATIQIDSTASRQFKKNCSKNGVIDIMQKVK